MARFDHGGGCACGLQKECDCKEAVVDAQDIGKKISLKLDLGGAVREAMIQGLADVVNAAPQFRFAVILRLLRDDQITRMMIAEAMGEAALKAQAADAANEKLSPDNLARQDYHEQSWDEIMGDVLSELEATPGGQGLTLPEVASQADLVDEVSDALHDCTVFSVEQSGDVLTIRGRHFASEEERSVSFKVK